MLVACNKRNTKWCPLKLECQEYHPRELLEDEDTEFCCVDEFDKVHDCEYIKVEK